MNAEKLNSWLSLGANIGVVIGLILLIVEINQNTQLVRAQINQSRADTAMSEQQATYTSDVVPAMLAKVTREEQLTDEEMIRYRTYLRAFNRNQDNNLWQYNQGFLGENIPGSIRDAARGVLGRNELSLSIWDRQKIAYTEEYVVFVEDSIEDLR